MADADSVPQPLSLVLLSPAQPGAHRGPACPSPSEPVLTLPWEPLCCISLTLGDYLWGDLPLVFLLLYFLVAFFRFPNPTSSYFCKGAEALRVPVVSLGVDSLSAIIYHCDHEPDPSRRNDRVAVLGWEGARLPHAALTSRPCPGCAYLVRLPCAPCSGPGVPLQVRGWGAVPAGPGPSQLDSVNPGWTWSIPTWTRSNPTWTRSNPSWTWSIPAGPGPSLLVPVALPRQGWAPHRSSGQDQGEGREGGTTEYFLFPTLF